MKLESSRSLRAIALCAGVSVAILCAASSSAQTVTDAVAGPPIGWPKLTEAQKLVAALRPPEAGGVGPGGDPGPTMPGADPRDLRGTWYHIQPLTLRIDKDIYGFPPPYKLEAAKTLVRRSNERMDGRPYLNQSGLCLPFGPLWQTDLNMPFSIFENSKGMDIVFMEYHGRWRIAYDAKDAPVYPDNDRPYMGNSVGHWEGNTFVVETTNFRQDIWLDPHGTPFSRNGKMIQRIRKVDNGDKSPFLQIETTIDDPTYYTKPWTIVRQFSWQPNKAYFNEYNCEEQIGDPSVSPDAGLPSETKELKAEYDRRAALGLR